MTRLLRCERTLVQISSRVCLGTVKLRRRITHGRVPAFITDSHPWVATRYCRDRSVIRWSWSRWNVSHRGMHEWKDETSQMPEGHSSQQWYEDRRSTCKDRFERTRHKMCCHQLNEWAWKNDEKVSGNTSQTAKTLVHE